jgi:myo-inositol 2-dehydrogenase / D-chiro-inositol 1-dehydrogenase
LSIRVALFGAGRIGTIHAEDVVAHPGSELAAVVDEIPAAAERLAGRFGARIASAEAVLADPGIDAVLICSPNDTHADLIERASAAGKAIFCEKPIDQDLARARLCLSRIRGREDGLFIGFNRRFDPQFHLVKQRVDAGEVGDVQLLTILSKDPEPPPAGYVERSGGLFRDMTIHDFDMARYLLPEEPVAVTAAGSSLVDPAIRAVGDIDTAVVMLQTSSGRLAVITNSRRSGFGYDQRIEVLGSNGMLSAGNPPRSTVAASTQAGITYDRPFDSFLDRYRDSYRLEWAHFVLVAEGRARPLVSGRDGERALALADAALESLRSGRRVQVPAVGDEASRED